MKKGWEMKKLGEVCELITKGTTPTSIGFKFTKEGVNFIKVESLTESGNIISQKVAFISNECNQALKRSQLKENDILFSIAGALGRIGIVTKEILPANTNQALAIIRLKSDAMISISFLAKYFISENVKKQIEKLRGGVAQQNLSLGQLNDLRIPVPTLHEQQNIISILDKSFAAIDQAKKHVQRNLQNAKELFQSEQRDVFLSKLHGTKNESLDDLCELVVDCEHKTAPLQSTGYPSIRTPNIGKGILLLDGVNRVSEETYREWTRRAIPQEDDLILAREAPAGNVAIIPKNLKVCLGQRTVLIRTKKDKLNPTYLAYILLSKDVQEKLLSHSIGATVQHINMKDIRAFKIYNLSSIEEQKKIVYQLDTLSTETKKLESLYQQKLNSLEELKKGILQKAFSGELIKEEVVKPQQAILRKIDGISTTDLHAGIIAIAFERHEKAGQSHTFHHVKSEKIIHLVENFIGIDLNRNPIKDAAGPNDFQLVKNKIESRAQKAGFFYVVKNGDIHNYRKGSNFDTIVEKASLKLESQLQQVNDLIDKMIPLNTQQAEIVATVFAAWNNLIIKHQEITDEAIVKEARENWHQAKLKIEREKFFKTIVWMKKKDIVPKGMGKLVLPK